MIWFFIVEIILVILIGISFSNENSYAYYTQRRTIVIFLIVAVLMFCSYSFTGSTPYGYEQQKISVELEEGITKEIDVYQDSDGNYYVKNIDKTKYWLVPFYVPEFVEVSPSDFKKNHYN